jgi:phosphatidylserine/phosphatidylglycerophosphate/cardiolipin synthase-like enzyme
MFESEDLARPLLPKDSKNMVDWKAVLSVNGKGVQVRDGNRVDYLVDGFATYQAMHEAISTTFKKEPGFYIYLLGWWLDDQFPLVPRDPESTVEKLFAKASKEYGVQVRVMLWKNLLMWPLNPKTQERQHNSFNSLPTGGCIIDLFLPTIWQSHHQKILIVKGTKGLIGFCGGLDIALDRIQKVTSHTGSPFHDVHCRIEGDGVCDLADVFVQRWQAHPDSKSFDAKDHLRGQSDRRPRKSTTRGSQSVGIARTFNAYRNGKWCAEELSVEECLMAAIGAAKRFIYIEDQYLISQKVAEALLSVLPHLQHVTILIPYSSDLPYSQLARAAFVLKLWSDKATAHKARVFHRLKGPHSYVHSKTWIFDDELAVIGSANCNRRGFAGDSEVCATVFDKPSSVKDPSFAQRLRMHLWSEHLGLSKDAVRDATNAYAWVTASKAEKVLVYDPFADATREEAQRFPSATGVLGGIKQEILSYLAGYSLSSELPWNNVTEIWDKVLDPLPKSLSQCQLE